MSLFKIHPKITICDILKKNTDLNQCWNIVAYINVGIYRVEKRWINIDRDNRPGRERHAIALASAHTRHIKNTRVVCRTRKSLYSVFSHFLVIPSISTFLFAVFTIAFIRLSIRHSTFYLLLLLWIITLFLRWASVALWFSPTSCNV